ncbi:MAG: glutamate 5-kinase [Methylobacteriaceae bacterium]|jgi:glutamate 5-kinase|nr:glutamate 5-kinase [Methylobacteriaceae bacterium]
MSEHPHIPKLESFHRIVVKIGSALLVDQNRGRLKHAWLASLVEDIAELMGGKREVIVVSSGAVALGRTTLKLPKGSLKLEEHQAAAAVGQIFLARFWSESLAHHDITSGQVLLTLQDTEERRRYLNARATVSRLVELGCVPVINENDTVATNEIRYGDNDRLAARVATMIGADLLVLFSDIDGLYTAPPHLDPTARHIPVVEKITPDIEAMAGDAASELSRGGMRTKIDAAKIAVSGGTHMVIADGRIKNPLKAIRSGARCSWFLTSSNPVTARKAWLAGALEPRGTLDIDAGALKALHSGKSLLPVGVKGVTGGFTRGDAVDIRHNGIVVAHGLVAYNSDEARAIAGRASGDIEGILGYPGRSEMVHRDDLAVVSG